jgi:hypothetical protein
MNFDSFKWPMPQSRIRSGFGINSLSSEVAGNDRGSPGRVPRQPSLGHYVLIMSVWLALVLAGVVADRFGQWAEVLIGAGTLGGMIGAGIGAYARRPGPAITRNGAIGGAAGLGVGLIVLTTDWIVG